MSKEKSSSRSRALTADAVLRVLSHLPPTALAGEMGLEARGLEVEVAAADAAHSACIDARTDHSGSSWAGAFAVLGLMRATVMGIADSATQSTLREGRRYRGRDGAIDATANKVSLVARCLEIVAALHDELEDRRTRRDAKPEEAAAAFAGMLAFELCHTFGRRTAMRFVMALRAQVSDTPSRSMSLTSVQEILGRLNAIRPGAEIDPGQPELVQEILAAGQLEVPKRLVPISN